MSKARFKQLQAARAARASLRYFSSASPPSAGPRSGSFGIDLKSSPIFASAEGKRDRKRRIEFEATETELRDKRKKRRVENPSPHLSRPEPPEPEELIELERKWNAVLEYSLVQSAGGATHAVADEIGQRWLEVNGRTVRNWRARVEETGSLLRTPGSGAPPSVTNRQDIIDFFEQQALDWEYEFTYEAMAQAIKGKFEGIGSTRTVTAIMNHLDWRRTRRVIRPFLTPDHMKARLDWSTEWINFDYFRGREAIVHIDEKCFYAFKERGRICYCPPGVDPEPLYALSKTQIPWCMFLGAVSPPRPEFNFDGKVGLWHVGVEKTALRRSKFHDKDEVYWTNINMDGDVFMQMGKDLLTPSIVEQFQWATKVTVQLDSAGGHRISESIEFLNAFGANSNPPITFRTQPCRGPDTNALDLGIWNSLSSRVARVKYDRSAENSMNQRIIDSVNAMWKEYPHEKLTAIFHTLNAVHRKIIACKGGNSFKQPRKDEDDD
jgi:transposase